MNNNKNVVQKSNNNKPKFKKVIDSDVKISKHNPRTKLSDVFIAKDIHSVGYTLVDDILIPEIKKILDSLVSNGFHMLLYGEPNRTKPKNGSLPGAKIAYQNFYSEGKSAIATTKTNKITSYTEYDRMIFSSKEEAETILDIMNESIETYGQVSILDLYDMVGISSMYASDNYGWKNLSKAYSERCADGYILRLPKAQPLN